MKKFIKQADIIILEEPANNFFESMLKGIISVDEYMQLLSEETFSLQPSFPLYTSQLCIILKSAYMQGKIIFQIEPYLEIVEKIYEFIDKHEAQGMEPSQILSEIRKSQEFGTIYNYEHITYKLLLEYYNSLSRSFDEAVDALLKYSRVEAQRLKLRSKMRAEKIIKTLKDINIEKSNVFIESGNIHLCLYHYLSEYFGDNNVSSIYLLNSVIKNFDKKMQYIIRSNDILTFMHIFNVRDDEIERLLAARSIIRLIMISENEISPSKKQQFPKMEEEIAIAQLISSLNYEQCKSLYYKLKRKY
ncbi:MAG: hypothetical protein ACP5GU_02720 [Thermoprotei archaeon]